MDFSLFRFYCEDIHAYDTKLAGDVLFARAAERIEPFAQRDSGKTYSIKGLD